MTKEEQDKFKKCGTNIQRLSSKGNSIDFETAYDFAWDALVLLAEYQELLAKTVSTQAEAHGSDKVFLGPITVDVQAGITLELALSQALQLAIDSRRTVSFVLNGETHIVQDRRKR